MNKLAITTGLALLLTTGYSLAEPMTSGRPSAVVDDAHATARVTFWGALAMATSAGIGKLFGTVV